MSETKTINTEFGDAVVEKSITRDFKNCHFRMEVIAKLQHKYGTTTTNVYKLLKELLLEVNAFTENELEQIYHDKLAEKQNTATQIAELKAIVADESSKLTKAELLERIKKL